jgi:hypothetical protein
VVLLLSTCVADAASLLLVFAGAPRFFAALTRFQFNVRGSTRMACLWVRNFWGSSVLSLFSICRAIVFDTSFADTLSFFLLVSAR